jgi:hypothetical protein
MLVSHCTSQPLTRSCRQRRTQSLQATTKPRHISLVAAAPRSREIAAASSAAVQTATTACSAAAVAAAMLLGCCMQPDAALALPQQQLEDIRQAIEKDFSEGVNSRSSTHTRSVTTALPHCICIQHHWYLRHNSLVVKVMMLTPSSSLAGDVSAVVVVTEKQPASACPLQDWKPSRAHYTASAASAAVAHNKCKYIRFSCCCYCCCCCWCRAVLCDGQPHAFPV